MLELWHLLRAESGRADDSVTLCELLIFVCKHRRLAVVNADARRKLEGVWCQLLATIAVHLDRYVLTVWPEKNPVALPPTVQRSGGRVKGGAVDAETAWHVVARSHEIYSATPGVVAATLSDTDAFNGVSFRTGVKCSETKQNYTVGRCIAPHSSDWRS